MKKVSRNTGIIFTATVLLALSASTASFADGMPFKKTAPKPILTPLDEALTEIENKEQPVPLAEEKPAPAPVAEPEPVKAKEEPKPLPPVPQARTVEVQPNTSFFGLSVGMYDPFSHGKKAASLNLEWQPGVRILGVLQPIFGAMATTNGAIYGYGGVGVPIKLSKRVVLMPSIAAGAYHEGDGYDLDRTLAFRFGTELAYEFDNKSRIGLNAHILTNGKSLDREDRTEVISLVYTTPLDIFAGSKKIDEKTAKMSESMPSTLPPPQPVVQKPPVPLND